MTLDDVVAEPKTKKSLFTKIAKYVANQFPEYGTSKYGHVDTSSWDQQQEIINSLKNYH